MIRTQKVYYYLNIFFLFVSLVFWTTDVGSPEFSLFLGTAGAMFLLVLHDHFKNAKFIVYIAYLLFVFGFMNELSSESVFLFVFLFIILRPPVTFLAGYLYSFWIFYAFLAIKEIVKNDLSFNLLYSFNAQIAAYSYMKWGWIFLGTGYLISVLPFYIEKRRPNKGWYFPISGFVTFMITLPFQFMSGIIVGMYHSIKNHYDVLKSVLKSRRPVDPVQNVEPAIENYWLGECFYDWRLINKQLIMKNNGARKYFDQKAAWNYSVFKFSLGIIPFVTLKIIAYSVVIIGFLYLIVVAIVHFMIVGTISLFAFLYFFIMHTYDTYHLRSKKIATICPICYTKSELPVYLCPHCDREHPNLRPNKYGIRKRQCECGELLPTSSLDNRAQLRAKCSNIDCQKELQTMEASPFVISAVGPPASGKTSFLTSAIHELKEVTAPNNGWQFDFLNDRDQTLFQNQSNALVAGQYPHKTVNRKPLAHNIKLTGDEWRNPKLLYLFDPAGELYENSRELRRHDYLNYVDGYVLMIDPFSLPVISEQYMSDNESKLQSVNPSTTLPEDVFHMLMNHISTKHNIKEQDKIDTPLAIVLHKVDAFNLEAEIAATVTGGEEHDQCKAFLTNAGYGAFIRQIETKFNTFKYFTSSAANIGDPNEERAAQVVTWLLAQK